MKPSIKNFIDFLDDNGVLDEYKECIYSQFNNHLTINEVWDYHANDRSNILNSSLDWKSSPSQFRWANISATWKKYVELGKLPNNNSYKSI